MRPVKLSFWGLRSYRERVDIDFTSLDLFAIIGDTGAGKSTIIEALTIALYAKKTWKGGGGLDTLICDGEPSFNIELTFIAEDQTWTVTRRRGRTTAPIDKLSSDGGDKVDGAKEVTARIQQLVGLDHGQFIRAVVLPQGRFDELLQTTPVDRTKVLRSILDLDDVTATRVEVDKLLSTWRAERDKWTAARDQYPPDPTGELAEAERQAAECVTRVEELDEATGRADAVVAEAEQISALRLELVSRLDRLPAVAADAVERLRLLAPSWREETSRREAIEREIAGIETRRSALVDETTATLAGFATRDALVGASGDIGRVVKDLPDALVRLGQAEQARDELGEPPPAGVDPALISAFEAAERDHVAAVEHVREADETADIAAELAGAWEDLAGEIAQATVNAEGLEADLADLDQRIGIASSDLSHRETEAGEFQSRLASALAADAAASAASACGPGDDCPVCRRVLPTDFERPAPSNDTESARADHEKAQRLLGDAKEVRTELLVSRAALQTKKDGAEQALSDAVARRDALLARCAERGLKVEGLTKEEALAPFAAVQETRQVALAMASEKMQAADDALAAANTQLAAAHATYVEKREAAERRVAEDQASADNLIRRVQELPDGWANAEVSDPVEQANAVHESLTEAMERLRSIQQETDELDQRDRELRSSLTEAMLAEQSTRADVMALVSSIRSRSDAVTGVRTWALSQPAWPDLVDGLPQLDPIALDVQEPADLESRLDVLSTSADGAQEVVDALAVGATALVRRSAAFAEELEGLVAAAGCASHRELVEARSAARAAADSGAETVIRLRGAAQRASEYDQRLIMVRPFVANLDALAHALRDGQFIGYLVSQREVELLAEASRRLKSISGERFAFSSGFRIISARSGEVREPEALSGGERFQAALALALALVEIASRGGGRLDSVFIDEGFGSLDSGSLDQALDALGAVSGGGKLVALVSHLRAVAEYVDDVIYVTKDDTTGSRLELLDANQQEELLDAADAGGLTA